MNTDTVGAVLSLNIKNKKGEQIRRVESCSFIEGIGIENDASAGKSERQVSILNNETVLKLQAAEKGLCTHRFAPNVVVCGISMQELCVGSKLCLGGAELEITQLGKRCFPECWLYQKSAACALACESIFARVLKGGIVKTGDDVRVGY